MERLTSFVELLRLLPTLGSTFAALPWLWQEPAHTREERTIAALFSGSLCLLLWPWDFSDCSKQRIYVLAFVVCFLGGGIGWLAERWIHGKFGYTQRNQTPRGETSQTVIGGPTLTTNALREQAENDSWDEQDLLEFFEYKPDRVWNKAGRTVFTTVYSAAQICKAVGWALAPLAAFAVFFFSLETYRHHSFLRVVPAAEQFVSPKGRITFTTNQRSCDSSVVWTLKGAVGDDLGGVADGFYQAPDTAKAPLEVKVVATSGGESQTMLVHVVPLPPGVTQYSTAGTDADGRPITLEPVIIEGSHSWQFNKLFLEGASGQDVVNALATSHAFDQYDDIICIGAASREYQSTLPQERERALKAEEDRAEQRARLLASWVSASSAHAHFRLHALRIGRYDAEVRLDPNETATERLVVLVGVKRRPGRIDLVKALREGFERLRKQRDLFAMYLDHYPEVYWKLIPISTDRHP